MTVSAFNSFPQNQLGFYSLEVDFHPSHALLLDPGVLRRAVVRRIMEVLAIEGLWVVSCMCTMFPMCVFLFAVCVSLLFFILSHHLCVHVHVCMCCHYIHLCVDVCTNLHGHDSCEYLRQDCLNVLLVCPQVCMCRWVYICVPGFA